jgi:hypothetical protein
MRRIRHVSGHERSRWAVMIEQLAYIPAKQYRGDQDFLSFTSSAVHASS